MTDRLPMSNVIAAYITAYQDSASLQDCIRSLQSQTLLSEIYILDNSPSPLPLPNSNIDLIQNLQPQNIGIAQGLAIAIDWAIQNHYQFLWLFDQDSRATPHCLEYLLQVYQQLQSEDIQPGIIAPTALSGNPPEPILAAKYDRYRFIGQPHQYDRPYYECIAPITSGSLLNLRTVQNVGYPNPDLFIDGVDIDYGIRLHQAGYPNYIATNAVLHHHFGSPYLVKWTNKTKILQNYSAIRHYYICRNHTYLDLKYANSLWRIVAFIFRLKYLFATLFWIVYFLPSPKKPKVWACCLGTYHGLKGKLGKSRQHFRENL